MSFNIQTPQVQASVPLRRVILSSLVGPGAPGGMGHIPALPAALPAQPRFCGSPATKSGSYCEHWPAFQMPNAQSTVKTRPWSLTESPGRPRITETSIVNATRGCP